MTSLTSLIEALEPALQARLGVLDAPHRCAVRLFNGFLEGWPDLVVDLYTRTLVIFNYADPSQAAQDEFQQAVTFYRERLPWLQAGVIKHRRSPDRRLRCGVLAFGAAPDRKVYENGVWYALDLLMNQDASFYLDTRNLRTWAKEHLRGKRVLN
ncbi:MAG TPA: class I SAM-dependent methyltransferase, partial [Anaerolineales bacterium]